MENDELLTKAAELCEKARGVKHPMLPAPVKRSIVLAAELLGELVRREVDRAKAR